MKSHADRSEATRSQPEQLRPRLLAIAYRMLGSVADAEDAVQDAYVRLQRAAEIARPEAWLVKATTRLCIDRLRQAKRRAAYHGPWLPEPVFEAWEGAMADRTELAESLSMAFLLMLETLSPAERAAYLLREAFSYEFSEIAELLDKTPANARQLVARAKRRLGDKPRRFQVEVAAANAMAERFFAACRAGDLDQIEAMLTSDARLYSDGGGKVFAAPAPLSDRRQIAKLLAVVFRKLRSAGELTLATINGRLGAVFSAGGQTVNIISLATEPHAVREVFVVLNPDKLQSWNSVERNRYETED